MSGASAHKSRTQRQARRLAADLAKGRMPASTVDLEDYLDRFPDDVFVALDGFVEQVASSGADDAIALGYLYLIQGQLERVRFRSERGYEDATRLIEEFQRAVADLAVTGRIDAQALSMVTSVLHMAGIEASAELHAGVTQFAENVLPLAVPPDFTDAMADMVAECEGDPFQLAGALAEAGHAIPAEARILMAVEQIRSTNAALREAAILYLLDGEPTLRRAVASVERVVVDECVGKESHSWGNSASACVRRPVKFVLLATEHPGIPDIEILDKLLDGRSALLTQDRVLHNLAIGRGFQSFVHTPKLA